MLKKFNNEKLKSFITKTQYLTSAGLVMFTPILYSYAGVKGMVANIIATVGDIFLLIGAVLLVWAVGQLVMAFRNEDADSKSRAMMLIVSSCLMMSTKLIAGALIDQSGIEGSGELTGGTSLLNGQ